MSSCTIPTPRKSARIVDSVSRVAREALTVLSRPIRVRVDELDGSADRLARVEDCVTPLAGHVQDVASILYDLNR